MEPNWSSILPQQGLKLIFWIPTPEGLVGISFTNQIIYKVQVLSKNLFLKQQYFNY